MKSRVLTLGIVAIVTATVGLMGSALSELRFETPQRISFASPPAQSWALPLVRSLQETSVWEILLFWLAMAASMAAVLVMLSPELRRRLLRHMVRLALGALMVLLALHYRILELPRLQELAEARGQNALTMSLNNGEPQLLQPPAVPSWITYLVSFVVLWLALAAGYFGYRSWQRFRSRRVSPLDSIAGIARGSLADLASGRTWEDVVLQAYYRMGEVISRNRGIERPFSATPREFAARLARLGLPLSAVDELTMLFERVRYGGQASDAGEARRASACLQSILQACGAGT